MSKSNHNHYRKHVIIPRIDSFQELCYHSSSSSSTECYCNNLSKSKKKNNLLLIDNTNKFTIRTSQAIIPNTNPKNNLPNLFRAISASTKKSNNLLISFNLPRYLSHPPRSHSYLILRY